MVLWFETGWGGVLGDSFEIYTEAMLARSWAFFSILEGLFEEHLQYGVLKKKRGVGVDRPAPPKYPLMRA